MRVAPVEAPDRGAAPRRARWRRRWRRARALGPAYFQVAVRWVGWGLAATITLLGGAPAINLEAAGPFLVLTFLQTLLFTVYYPFLHLRVRPFLRRAHVGRVDGGALWAVVDLLLSVAAVAGTGGFRSPFFQYALTSVMFPALVFRWRGALVAASSFVILYLLAVFFAGDGLAGVYRAGQLDSFLAALADAYLIALFCAYLADLLSRLQLERRRTAAASRETRALYAVAQSILESPPERDALYARTVAAVRRHLRLPGFAVYAAEGVTATRVAGYGLPDSPPPAPRPAAVADGAGGGFDEGGEARVRAPLVVDGRTVGWLVARHRPGAGASADALVRALAGQVTLGLRNAALAREKADLAAAGERARLAREIHDGVAQSLYMLTLNLEACAELATRAAPAGGGPPASGRPAAAAPAPAVSLAGRLEQLLGLARQALWEVRHYIFDLKPLLGGEASLAEVLRNPLREFQTIAGLPAELRTEGRERPLSLSARAAVYRVLQEALANAFKHACATRVDVALRWEPAQLVLEVRDDGAGFDRAVAPRGHGLDNLAQRAAEIGGTATIDAAPGAGTRVQLTVPYTAE